MQDNYVSLNPENTKREERAIRANLYSQRLLESQGGEASMGFDLQLGLTASVLTYSMLSNKGFTIFPLLPNKM